MCVCVCVCVCVITTGASCIHEQNGCIIGDVHDTLLSVGVFFSFFFLHVAQTLITGVSAGEVRQGDEEKAPVPPDSVN